MNELRISPDLSLPLEAVTEAFAILAVSGAGKSNAGVVLAEELYDNNLPWVAIDPKGDWWGVRSSADGTTAGLSVVVFGGEHADVPLEPGAGRYIADLIVEKRLTCVLDVSEMTKADQRRFLIDFAERLYKRNREPLMVICEEADEYIPQMVRGDMAKLVGAMETLVKRGRFRGIGTCLITQRSASLNKDVLSQARNLLVLQTTSPQDRKAILDWIRHHAASQGVVDELPQLQPGEAYLFSPAWLRTLQRLTFRRRRTYDSGATPKIGEKRRPPARLADVDLAAIKDAMAETIERAKADDPKELRKRIAELERHRCPEPAAVKPQTVEVPILDAAARALVEQVTERWATAHEQAVDVVRTLRDALARIGASDGRADVPRTRAASDGPRPVERRRAQERADSPARRESRRSTVQRTAETPSDLKLGDGAKRMLTALAQHHPLRLTRRQVATMGRVKVTGGTFGTYWSQLKTNGLIDEKNPHDVGITDAGLDVVGTVPASSPDDLIGHYRIILKGGARRMFDALLEVFPASMRRDELAAAAGIEQSGGTFGTYLSTLRRNSLVLDTDDGELVASDALFLKGA